MSNPMMLRVTDSFDLQVDLCELECDEGVRRIYDEFEAPVRDSQRENCGDTAGASANGDRTSIVASADD